MCVCDSMDSTDSSSAKPEAESHDADSPATTSADTSSECRVHKPASSRSGSVDEHFGARVLRLSRKILRRSRSVSDVEGDATPTPDVVVR